MTMTKNLADLPRDDHYVAKVFVPFLLEICPWLAPRKGAIFAAAQRASALDQKQPWPTPALANMPTSRLGQLFFSLYCIGPGTVGRFGSVGYHVCRREICRHDFGWRFTIQTVFDGHGWMCGHGNAPTREEARRQLQSMAREFKNLARGLNEPAPC